MSAAQHRRLRIAVNASRIVVIHTYLAFGAFFSALAIGCLLHYKTIVKNGVAGYPEEWFPSVSATIGDWYPERSIFQILIALNSGPRFALVFLQYYLQRSPTAKLPGLLLAVGVIRTLSCGGWVYITSSDDHDWHDILMITYIVCNIPWMYGGIACTPLQNAQARRRRRWAASGFFLTIVPLVYYFIQHKIHEIPGAYTRYSFFEWGLIVLDILYDSVSALDFSAANLQVSVGISLGSSQEANDITAHAEKEEKPRSLLAKEKSNGLLKDITLVISSKPPVEKMSTPAKATGPSGFQTKPTQSAAGMFVNFLCDLYLSYLFWSVFTALALTLFYFSVWELGIAGQELTLLSTLSPIFLGIPQVLDVASSRAGRTALHILTLIGLVAYKLESPLSRLFAVTFANACLFMGMAVDWSARPAAVGYQGILLGLGLLASSLAKHANHSNNPVWPILDETSGGYNKTGLVLALFAIWNYYSRSCTDPSSFSEPVSQKSNKRTTASSEPIAVRKRWSLDALALGSLIFSLHSLLSDSSTLITWSWTGYPIKGPVPHLHGSLTHIAQAIGLFIPVAVASVAPQSEALAHPLWFVYGSASMYVMYAYKDWLGYIGSLNVAIFLMSIIPMVMMRAASSGSVAKTYTLAMLAVCLFDVANVFTVAYAFVPGGVYFRERTNWVLAVQMACLALAFRWHRISASTLSVTIPKSARASARNTLAILSILSLLVTMYRWPTKAPQPYRTGPRIVRAGIWTVHFGIDNEGRDSQRRMRKLIGDMQLDVVGLLETDLHRVVYGNRDLTRVMIEDLGYYVDLGPGPNSHTWGAVLMSKFPIINSTHHLLPSPDGELAPAIHAVLDMFGTEVHVVVAHNGQEETPLDRELQSTELARIMSEAYPHPLIFLGYVVTKAHALRPAPYDIMVNDGRVYDIDGDDWDRWCQYIFYRGLYRTSYVRVSRSTITDTELQIGQFLVPKHGVGVTNDTHEAKYSRAWQEELPAEHWFPPEYFPTTPEGGVRGHFYHVFNTPLYYHIPEGAVL